MASDKPFELKVVYDLDEHDGDPSMMDARLIDVVRLEPSWSGCGVGLPGSPRDLGFEFDTFDEAVEARRAVEAAFPMGVLVGVREG